MRIRFLFVPRDLWIGAYIKKPYLEGWNCVHLTYVLPLPMLGVTVERAHGTPSNPAPCLEENQ
jgi:hypothetical protein